MQGSEIINLHDRLAGAGSENDPSLDELPTGTTLLHGQYRITEFLNSGGFGITYRAKDSLDRDVVIKECFPSEICFRSGNEVRVRKPAYKDDLASVVAQFVKEAHSLAKLKHKNIVHVHQIFEENATAYMAMDYIDGRDLLEIVEDEPDALTPKHVVQLTSKMLQAIKYIHACGMLHRDISPDNIIIDLRGEPVLIDFGAARKHAGPSGRVLSRMKFVKDGYSPKEFYIAGSEQGTWSDLYSLAASIYHVITGEAPEVGQKRLAAIAAKQPDPYRTLVGNIQGYPLPFLAAIDKSLELLPENRLQTADDWLATSTRRRVIKKIVPAVSAQKEQEATVSATAASATSQSVVRNPTASVPARSGEANLATVIPAAALSATLVVFGFQYFFSSNDEGSAAPSEAGTLPDIVFLEPTPNLILAETDSPTLGAPKLAPTDQTDEPNSEPLTVAAKVVDIVEAENPVDPLAAMPERISFLAYTIPETKFAPSSPGIAPSKPSAEVGATPRPGIVTLPNLKADEPSVVPVDAVVPQVWFAATQTMLPESYDIAVLGPVAGGPTPVFAEIHMLPSQLADDLAIADLSPPDPLAATVEALPAPQEDTFVHFAHWDVDMPFTATLAQVRNANIARITAISETVDLSVSGEWIEEGVTIFAFNGDALSPEIPLSTYLLNALQIDPDGYARATIRYSEPSSGNIDRGLLAVPVVRKLRLADGTSLEARVVDLAWVVTVTSLGDGMQGTLQVGDVLVRELTSGTDIATPDDLDGALRALMLHKVGTAEFRVVRDGNPTNAQIRLSHES